LLVVGAGSSGSGAGAAGLAGVVEALAGAVRGLGLLLCEASEGEAALENFAEWRPELVITDLYMPHMDGVELCRRIRAVSGVPIIVLSVKGEERTKVEALDSGADDYVTKPFGIDELLARVRAETVKTLAGYVRAPDLVPPALGERAGVLGALALAQATLAEAGVQ